MPADIRSLCRAYTPETVRIVAGIVRAKSTPPAVRLTGIAMLWERGWGKPPTTIAGADGDGAIAVVVRHILEGSSTPRPVAAIEHETVLSNDNTVSKRDR